MRLDNIVAWGPGRDGDKRWSERVPYDEDVSSWAFIWAILEDENIRTQVSVAKCRWVADEAISVWTGNDGTWRWRLLVTYRRDSDPPVCSSFS